MEPRVSSCAAIRLLACAILAGCGGCGGTTLKDLAHKKLVASSMLGITTVSGEEVIPFAILLHHEGECHAVTSVSATVNGVALRWEPGGGPVYYAEGQPIGCREPGGYLPLGAELPPSADGRHTVLLSDSSMQIEGEFGDFLIPASASLRSPTGRIAHPQDEVVVDFSPPPGVFNFEGLPQVRAGFLLDARILASYGDVRLMGSSASFRLPANVVGQGHLMAWWVFDVTTVRCQGAESCTGSTAHEVDLGPFEIRN